MGYLISLREMYPYSGGVAAVNGGSASPLFFYFPLQRKRDTNSLLPNESQEPYLFERCSKGFSEQLSLPNVLARVKSLFLSLSLSVFLFPFILLFLFLSLSCFADDAKDK